MRANLQHDLVVTLSRWTGEVEVPAELEGVPLDRLRFDGASIVDGAAWTGDWWVDPAGTKHVTRHDPSWQLLACAWSDVLVQEAGAWRAETSAEAVMHADAAIVAAAHRRIDRLCDEAYTRSPSRDARYARKADEARRYIAAGKPSSVAAGDYPVLKAEAEARGITKGELADMILSAEAAQAAIDATAEAARALVSRTVAIVEGDAAKRDTAAVAVRIVADAIAARPA